MDSIAGFRNVSWGESPEEVKKKEKAKYLQVSKGWDLYTLTYQGEIAGFPARIDYTFRNDSLIEGSYSIQQVQSFYQLLSVIKNFLLDLYGKPDYANVNALNSDSVWTAGNPGILYNGPQYFWEFTNGFISLYSSKFITSDQMEQIAITILYVPDTKISEYSDSRLVPIDELKFPQNLWNRPDP